MMDRNFKTVNIRGEKKYYMKQNKKKWGMEKNGEILFFKGGKT